MLNYLLKIIVKFQNPSTKQQISTKFQFSNDQNGFGHWNFGHCNLFVIWDLLFGI